MNMKSKYKGVFIRKNKNSSYTYIPKIFDDGYQIILGHYKNEIDAAKRYDKFALLLRGRGAKLNFPIILNCECEDCKEKAYKFSTLNQTWMCKTHYYLLCNNDPSFKREACNKIVRFDNYAMLYLYDNNFKLVRSLKISLEDIDAISKYKWYNKHSGSPIANIKINGKYKTLNLGKYILDNDYKNKNRLLSLSVHFINKDENDYRHNNLFLRTSKQKITQDEKCINIHGLYYDVRYQRYVVDKQIKRVKYRKKFKVFNDALKYLNKILCENGLEPIDLLKGDISND